MWWAPPMITFQSYVSLRVLLAGSRALQSGLDCMTARLALCALLCQAALGLEKVPLFAWRTVIFTPRSSGVWALGKDADVTVHDVLFFVARWKDCWSLHRGESESRTCAKCHVEDAMPTRGIPRFKCWVWRQKVMTFGLFIRSIGKTGRWPQSLTYSTHTFTRSRPDEVLISL